MRVLRCLAGAGISVALLGGAMLPGVVAAAQAAQPTLDSHSMTVSVRDMVPTTPAYTSTPRPLTITLVIKNTTDTTLYDINLDVERDAPVTQESQLAQLMANPAPSPDRGALSPLPAVRVDAPLAPGASRTLTYRTTTTNLNEPNTNTICLCIDNGGGVYPINFTAFAATEPHADQIQVGFGQTYLPSFKDKPLPVRVSWVWPLIDRPHRVADNQPFFDDDLATSVRPGGRLFRALTVVESVAPRVHLTLVIDPELIDELYAMGGGYKVQARDGKTTEGTGADAARVWLKRLQSVITSTEVSLTPYADPDIDAVARAGLTWKANFGAQQLQRLQLALGVPAPSDIAWPADETVTPAALQQVLSRGSSIVVLSDAMLPGTRKQSPTPDALAPLPAKYGVPGAVAAVTDGQLQNLSSAVLSGDRSPTAALPQLVSALAVRAAGSPAASPYVVITADRYVNTDPAVAERTILETASTDWSTSLTLGDAARTIKPVDHGQLINPVAAPSSEIPAAAINAAVSATTFVESFSSALSNNDAALLLDPLSGAIQRMESAAWRRDPAGGVEFANGLESTVSQWSSGVYIVRPSSGTYTLASTDSPLPITVVNTLSVDVKVRVSITTLNGVVGFATDDTVVQTIPRAASPTNPTRSTLKIQTHVQRSGNFRVTATLLAPDGTQLSPSVPLSIHCTALGVIGVIITAAAGAVLVLALAYRVVRRVRSGPPPPTAPAPQRPEPAGVGA